MDKALSGIRKKELSPVPFNIQETSPITLVTEKARLHSSIHPPSGFDKPRWRTVIPKKGDQMEETTETTNIQEGGPSIFQEGGLSKIQDVEKVNEKEEGCLPQDLFDLSFMQIFSFSPFFSLNTASPYSNTITGVNVSPQVKDFTDSLSSLTKDLIPTEQLKRAFLRNEAELAAIL